MLSVPIQTIDYPVELCDIVVIGYLGPQERSFTVRPTQPGRYELLIWPTLFPLLRWLKRTSMTFKSTAGPPVRQVFTATQITSSFMRGWSWTLVKVDPDGSTPTSIADLVFGGFPTAKGQFELDVNERVSEARTLAWSCHQPFESLDGRAILRELTHSIFDWYQKVLDEFSPDIIWGEGDTSYADGISETDFVDQVYDHPGWQEDASTRSWLLDSYRRMYRYHWSVAGMNRALRNFPHILMWDDHEIRDGWGSESSDFADGNQAMFDIARQAASEYVLDVGPRVRDEGDAHRFYIRGAQASFIFDTRTSRHYSDPGGKLISQTQLNDFRSSCEQISGCSEVKFLVLGTTVPFLYMKDLIENLGSKAPKAITDKVGGVRDDLRDSWLAPGNQAALQEILDIVKSLLWSRPSLHVINVSGDIHVANAFEIWPLGFARPIYQVTTSAITNRDHLNPIASQVLAQDGIAQLPVLGLVRKLWDEITDPNVLCITTTEDRIKLQLKVYQTPGSKFIDQELVLQ